MTSTSLRLCLMLALVDPAIASPRTPAPNDGTVLDTSFAAGDGHVYDARIHLPPRALRNGRGVLMLGGGSGNDLDWTAPGHLEQNGERTQVTISGEPHADAPALAAALAARGYVVMHYTTIRRGDPKTDRWPYEATLHTPAEHLALARSALMRLRAEDAVTDGRVHLLGHSLGGQRACAIAAEDDRIEGLILLGSAQATVTGSGDRGRNLHRGPSEAIMAAADGDGSGFVDRVEFEDFNSADDAGVAVGAVFDTIDFDDNGRLRAWEFSAALAREDRRTHPPADDDALDSGGVPFSEFALRRRETPALFIYGELDDAQACHAPTLADLIAEGRLRNASVVVIPGVGHMMGPQVDGRIGPIDETVLTAVLAWLAR